jgi:hypothetical protein
MKITTITYMERKNKGNYEHEEMTAVALIEEGDTFDSAMIALKDSVHNALYGTLNKEIIKEVEVTATPVKEKKTKKAKVEAVEVTVEAVIPEVIVEEKKAKPSKVTKYDSNVPEHKSIFGGHLSKNFGDTWKTVKPVTEIKAFTSSLNGMDFIDTDGKLVGSFVATVQGFFGA